MRRQDGATLVLHALRHLVELDRAARDDVAALALAPPRLEERVVVGLGDRAAPAHGERLEDDVEQRVARLLAAALHIEPAHELPRSELQVPLGAATGVRE